MMDDNFASSSFITPTICLFTTDNLIDTMSVESKKKGNMQISIADYSDYRNYKLSINKKRVAELKKNKEAKFKANLEKRIANRSKRTETGLIRGFPVESNALAGNGYKSMPNGR